MSAKFNIKERLIAYFKENDWKFREENDHVISAGINIKSKLKSVRILFVIGKCGYTSYAVCHLNADEAERDEVMKYITMANYGLRNGNFEMDLSDGEIRYKIHVDLDGLEEVTDDIIETSLAVPCMMFDKYGDGLAKLIMGFSDADTEIEEAEGESTHGFLRGLLGSDNDDEEEDDSES